MAPSHDIFDSDQPEAASKGASGESPGDPTAVDLGVSLPEYLQEIQATLEGVERAAQKR